MKTQEIWHLYAEDLRRLLISLVKSEDIAEDLLQETFIKIHNKQETIKTPNKIKAWCLSIARNTAYDYFRKKGLEQPMAFEEPYEEDDTQEHSEKDCLRAHIMNLDKKYRTPLFLADIKGLKHRNIASQLQLSLPTVKSRIQRARKKITEGYMHCCNYKFNEKGVLVGEHKDIEDCKICNPKI